MLSLWGLAGISLIGLFTDWFVPVRKIVVAPPAPVMSDDAIYTGSIVYVPRRGELCWQRTLDNRNGGLHDIGYLPCDQVVSDLAVQASQAAYRANRFMQVRSSFAHN